MAENQRMCVYYEENKSWSYKYYCKSPGNTCPQDSRVKNSDCFRNLCRRADDRGWQCQCPNFIEPECTEADLRTVPAGSSGEEPVSAVTKGRTGSEPYRERATERLTYLSRMQTGSGRQNVPPADAVHNTQPGQNQQDSDLAGKILKAGAKAAVDMGKTALDPMGSTAEFVADAAKKLIDEL